MDKGIDQAKAYAFKLLSYRPRSRNEIRQKLKEKGFSEEIIFTLLEFLEEYGLVNDAAFARTWVRNRCNLKPMGRNRLKQELLQKGIPQEIISEELALLSEEEEYQLAMGLATGKLARGFTQAAKIAGFLERRGFSYQVIKRVLLSLGTA